MNSTSENLDVVALGVAPRTGNAPVTTPHLLEDGPGASGLVETVNLTLRLPGRRAGSIAAAACRATMHPFA